MVRVGAALDVEDRWGDTALTLAATRNQTAIVQESVCAGAALHVQNKEGWTALMIAQVEGHSDIEAILEEATAAAAAAAANSTD